jgi:hypothetical protein
MKFSYFVKTNSSVVFLLLFVFMNTTSATKLNKSNSDKTDLSTSTNTEEFYQNFLTNKEIEQILKCFGPLSLREGCVICRYIIQKIYKVLDITAMCPDIVETQLLSQRNREWKPDEEIMNKWIVLYKMQKDYVKRIKPGIDKFMGFDKTLHEEAVKKKVQLENLASLIQFQNKVNADIVSRSKKKNEKDCKDDSIKQTLDSISPDFNSNKKNSINKHNDNINNPQDLVDSHYDLEKNKVEKQYENYFHNKKTLNGEVTDENGNSNNLNLSSSVFNNDILSSKIGEFMGKPKDKRFFKFKQKDFVLQSPNENNNENNFEIKDFNKNLFEVDSKFGLENGSSSFLNNMLKDESISYLGTSIGTPYIDSSKNQVIKQNLKDSQINTNQQKYQNSNSNLVNMPTASSFMETEEQINILPIIPPIMHKSTFQYNKDLFDTLVKRNKYFNLETMRRGRRRSRFPDPQWDCVETQVAKLLRYLCEEEVSSSYQIYCKPIFHQISTIVESFLYHDNNIEICQNIHMCPVTASNLETN